MRTWALSRAAGMTLRRSATCSSTSDKAACRGKGWRSEDRSGIEAEGKQEKYERIMDMKMDTPVEKLCQSMPKGFAMYLKHCRSLRYEEAPNYAYLLRLVRGLLARSGRDLVFDWPPLDGRLAAPGKRLRDKATAELEGEVPQRISHPRSALQVEPAAHSALCCL
mmetsp:Transcript_4404/g.10272  ORF Transcript_4404/g.10272 Transcript_4404/m.10272 type:complete len:165 (-) Transcript_4404:36-530(-)